MHFNLHQRQHPGFAINEHGPALRCRCVVVAGFKASFVYGPPAAVKHMFTCFLMAMIQWNDRKKLSACESLTSQLRDKTIVFICAAAAMSVKNSLVGAINPNDLFSCNL